MRIEIVKITIVLFKHAADLVLLKTNLPSATPGITDQSVSLQFAAAKDTGVAYAAANFPGVPVEIIKS